MKEWLQSGCTHVIQIPSHSPEFNIAENFFADFTPRIEQHNAKTKKELKDTILNEWPKTDSQLLKKRSNSMIARCKEVQISHGHKINH